MLVNIPVFPLKMAFEDDKKFWKEFIELYREQNCLWDVNSKDYSNRGARNRAYSNLVIKCREKYPNAEKYFVAKKINSLRTSFRRQFRKLQHSKNPIAEPTLWYFDLLLFTIDQDELRAAAAFPSEHDELGYEDMSTNETVIKQEYIVPEPHYDRDSDAGQSYSPERMEQELAPVVPSKPGWRKKKETVNSKDLKKKDTNTLYGEFVADSIRNLKNKSIQSWVRNQISNVLYTAEQVYFQSICHPRVEGMNFNMDTSTLPKLRREEEENISDSEAKQPKESPLVNESVSTSPSTSKATEIFIKEEPPYFDNESPSPN